MVKCPDCGFGSDVRKRPYIPGEKLKGVGQAYDCACGCVFVVVSLAKREPAPPIEPERTKSGLERLADAINATV